MLNENRQPAPSWVGPGFQVLDPPDVVQLHQVLVASSPQVREGAANIPDRNIHEIYQY